MGILLGDAGGFCSCDMFPAAAAADDCDAGDKAEDAKGDVENEEDKGDSPPAPAPEVIAIPEVQLSVRVLGEGVGNADADSIVNRPLVVFTVATGVELEAEFELEDDV